MRPLSCLFSAKKLQSLNRENFILSNYSILNICLKSLASINSLSCFTQVFNGVTHCSGDKHVIMLVICSSLLTSAQGNKAYPLQMDSGEVFVYCCMSGHDLGECEDGGWTLVMKIDGKKGISCGKSFKMLY